ncbi:MAG: hypothetical protein PF443_00200 [Allgaiera sp.]|jgi:hypothetical protein|nr:hypothetical protein [Allgaiera sp.]
MDNEYPAMPWHRLTGELSIITGPEGEHEDLITCHPEDPDAERKGVEVPTTSFITGTGSMTKAEIVAALKQGGVPFTQADPKAELEAKLRTALTSALLGAGAEVSQDEDLRVMLTRIAAL